MRFKKHQIRQRIHGNLHIEFAPQSISSYSGLELFKRYFRLIGLNSHIQKVFRGYGLGGDYTVVDFILVFIALWLTGGNRLRHIRYIAEDPLVQRLCGLEKLPADRTISRWLGQFTNDSLQALVKLNSELVLVKLEEIGVGTITLDFDGTVLSCGNKVQWAFRGYNPMNRHAKSYFPILCHVAQTGHFLQVRNRPGNVHDSKCGALEVIKDCIEQVRHHLPGVRIEVRMDPAFFQQPILQYLNRENIRYAIKVPMWKWLGLKEKIQARRRWRHATKKLAWFKDTLDIECWDEFVELIFFRHKISDHPPKKGHQPDFFTPDDGVYEYSVICSNKNLSAASLFDFYNGRCAMENQIAELKGEFGFASIPTRHYQGNSAHQLISILAHNLVKNFQIDTNLAKKTDTGPQKTTIFSFQSLRSIRFEWIAVAGRLLKLSKGKTLRISSNPYREQTYQNISSELDALAMAA